LLGVYGEANIPSISPHNSEMLVNAISTMCLGSATYKFDHGFIKVGTKQDLLRLQQSDQFGAYLRDNFNPELIEMVDSWVKQITQPSQAGSN
jgi:hypothetical protein